MSAKASSRRSQVVAESFGKRLARLRRARGLSQAEFGAKVDLSSRMVCYYEAQGDRPPAHVLARIAQVLGASTDELLGVKPLRVPDPPTRWRLWRRLRVVETLSPEDRKAVVQFAEALAERRALKEKVG